VAVLKKDRWIVAAHSRTKQAYGILHIAGKGQLPAYSVSKKHLVTQAVPRITAFGKSTGHTNDNRRRKFIGGPPADGTAVVELFRSRIGIFSELNFCHGHQSIIGQAHGPPDNAPFGEACIKHTGFGGPGTDSHGTGVQSPTGSHILTKNH